MTISLPHHLRVRYFHHRYVRHTAGASREGQP